MLSNYLKLAFKVLGRNRFFTGISLFGISFTLMILMLIAALFDSEFGKNPPLSGKGKMVFLNRVAQELIVKDTIWEIDSSAVQNGMAPDSTFRLEDNVNSTSISGVGFHLLDRYMRELADVEASTFFSTDRSFDLFFDNRKLTVNALYCDADYWQVFDFTFLEGVPFTAAHLENSTPRVVITDQTAKQYFGQAMGVTGKTITLGSKLFTVTGVVAKPQTANGTVAADVFLPYTTIEDNALSETDYQGGFQAVFLTTSTGARKQVQDEIMSRTAALP
ncbi:MAG: ABC transporter permease [Saprospiraceae bacterium]